MKFPKSMFILLLVIFLFSIAAVSASDVDDSTLASEDANQMELSSDGETAEDNLKISEENNKLIRTSNEEPVIKATDSETLSAGEGNYSDLRNDINNGAITKTLYRYVDGDGDTIKITNPGVIDGKGAIIDMAEKNIRALEVTTSGVTIKNLTIINVKYYEVYGGAIYFSGSGTVENCNFIKNTAQYGGALYFESEGTVTNCNFSYGYASLAGGAIEFVGKGTVTNCSFTGNYAYRDGGAIYFNSNGIVTNCIFNSNTVDRDGGAIMVWRVTADVDTCIFKTQSDTTFGTNNFPPALNVDNYTSVYKSGEKLTFDLRTNISSIPVTNGNISISVYFKNNNSWVGNYSCLSGEGWIPDLPIGFYYATFNTEYAGFQPINRTITIKPIDHTFGALNYTINTNNDPVINLTDDFYFDSDYDISFVNGIVINRPVTINGNGHTIDAKYLARIFYVTGRDVILENITFINANTTGNGGAVYFSQLGSIINCNFTDNQANYGGAVWMSSGTVTNCNFTNNKATADYSFGGAIDFNGQGTVTNCNFTDNNAYYGGAIMFIGIGTGSVSNCYFTDNNAYSGGAIYFIESGTVTNCNFTGNNATNGSAIYFSDTSNTKTVSNSRFLNNRANAEALEVTKNDNNITIIFTGNNNLLNAIYSKGDVIFTNVTYWDAKGINNTGDSAIKPSRSNKEAGQNVTVRVLVNSNLVLNEVKVTDGSGMIVLDIKAGDNYYITARHDTDSYYTEAENTISNMNFTANVTSVTTHNKTVNITAKSNIFNEVFDGKLLFILPNDDSIIANYAGNGNWWALYTFDDYGDYQVNATYNGLNVIINNATISISKTPTNITVQNATINLFVRDSVGAGATLTPADAGNLAFTSSNSSVAKIENGNIIAVGEGSAIITVSFAGSDDYEAAENKTITVNVKRIVTNITIDNATVNLFVKDSISSGATLTPAIAGNLAYTSSNASVVVVEDGNIIAVGEGTATITVSFAGDDRYVAAENRTIEVSVSLKDASVSAENIVLDIGDNATIAPVTSPEGLDVTYVVDNSGVVTVENGIVTAVKEGDATIILTVGGDGIYVFNSTTITVTVNKKDTNAVISIPENITVGENSTVYIVLPDDATGNVVVRVDGEIVDNVTVVDGQASVTISPLSFGNHTIEVAYSGDDKYNPVSETKDVASKENAGVNITIPSDIGFGGDASVDIKLAEDAEGNVTLIVDGKVIDTVNVTNGSANVKLPSLDAGNHTVEIVYSGDDKYQYASKTATVSINKDSTKISAVAVTATYNVNKYLVITLTDSHNKPLTGAKVTVVLNAAKKYNTDKNGKIKIKISNLLPKTYTAKITFGGNGNYIGSNAKVKVVVKKAKPKITAKKKKFKKSKKVKKYTITLKNNVGKAMKKVKVTLKIKGKKAITVKTNAKGKATFKIKKLTKKGTYKAKIKFKGNKYYSKANKKVKIRIK